MSAKLNREQTLRQLLRTLVDGWGYKEVARTLGALESGARKASDVPAKSALALSGAALTQVKELKLNSERQMLLEQLASDYDQGSAFPKLSDARAFLIAHQQDVKTIKSRQQAFKKMIPVLIAMSDKGLDKLIVKARHSGPADLDSISRAIRGAGENLRGTIKSETPSKPIESDSPSDKVNLISGEGDALDITGGMNGGVNNTTSVRQLPSKRR